MTTSKIVTFTQAAAIRAIRLRRARLLARVDAAHVDRNIEIVVFGVRAVVDIGVDTIRVWDAVAEDYVLDISGAVSAWARPRILEAARREAARRAS